MPGVLLSLLQLEMPTAPAQHTGHQRIQWSRNFADVSGNIVGKTSIATMDYMYCMTLFCEWETSHAAQCQHGLLKGGEAPRLIEMREHLEASM